MKLLIDFFPLLLFFLAYKFYGLFVATGVIIIATVAQIGWMWKKHKRVETMHWVTCVLLIVFGGATLLLNDPAYLMLKVTVINWLFAIVLLGSQFIGKKNMLQRLLDGKITLPDKIWLRLNLLWTSFFSVIGLINLSFARPAIAARDSFLNIANFGTSTDMKGLSCETEFTMNLADLCLQAQVLENAWVNFKFMGVLGLTLVFIIGQTLYISRYIKTPSKY